ncbi:M1 family metallopeptidase [Polyangium jinanense]|uniref:Aminopeptidase N n=1 Tax=Polyangium jinanense TaxID=2829994 RepID=A0A9X3XFW8_9BACT|nr:M1 family aminopeptidase [Polyangium jinanense]MDC3958440.1 aminopeptidase [Polyangium jinanense]MDC3987993.1 aminopeptidase [Polyangium jinanense]
MRPLRLAFLSALSLPFLTTGCGSSPLEDATRGYDVERYALEGAFDWTTRKLAATVSVTLTLTEDTPAIALDSHVTVKAVRITGVEDPDYEVDVPRGVLAISLEDAPKATKGQTIEIEIDYEAGTSDNLYAIATRRGDPVISRALFTDSEPLGTSWWMPCTDDPSDRATFSVSLKIPAQEQLIANGRLVLDAEEGPGSHRVQYESGWTLPTYQMAFAVSQFEVAKSHTETGLPVEVWHRRELPGSHAQMAKALAGMIDRFEPLIGPYPFERYALVLLPSFPGGGMENAGISFQRETSSTEPALYGDFYLAAHELAHQWFGDLVTLETWDDIWIKEGMANQLEYEAGRAFTDASGEGTLHGDQFFAEDGVPIRNKALAPADKYTSGPYDRAAWLHTQIRSVVGEAAYFETLRKILDAHRFGTIGTDAFINAFAEALGPEATARVRRALDATAMPRIELHAEPNAAFALVLDDPDGAVVAPLVVRWYGADGSAEEVSLLGGARAVIPAAGTEVLLVVDPGDVHPEFEVAGDEAHTAAWLAARVPLTANGKTVLAGLGGAAQMNALRVAGTSSAAMITPAEITGLLGELDADGAKALALQLACGLASSSADAAEQEAWAAALAPLLEPGPPSFGLGWIGAGLGACGDVVPPDALFSVEWPKLEAGLVAEDVPLSRLQYLGAFQLPDDRELATFGVVASKAPSLRARRIALDHLARRARDVTSEAWVTFYLDLLRATRTSETLPSAMNGASWAVFNTGAGLGAFVDELGDILHDEVTRPAHARAICIGVRLLADDPAATKAFLGGLANAPLSEPARAILSKPETCL